MSHDTYNRALPLGLPAPQKAVLLVLANAQNSKTHQCNPSIRRLVQWTGFGRTAVVLAIRRLKARGLIVATRGSTPGASNNYEFLLPDPHRPAAAAAEHIDFQYVKTAALFDIQRGRTE